MKAVQIEHEERDEKMENRATVCLQLEVREGKEVRRRQKKDGQAKRGVGGGS